MFSDIGRDEHQASSEDKDSNEAENSKMCPARMNGYNQMEG